MRLIDADAIGFDPEYLERDDLVHFIKTAPTIDAVPVVRCRECKHRDPEDHKCDCGHGILWQLPREDDWFCADGERKDGADNG